MHLTGSNPLSPIKLAIGLEQVAQIIIAAFVNLVGVEGVMIAAKTRFLPSDATPLIPFLSSFFPLLMLSNNGT